MAKRTTKKHRARKKRDTGRAAPSMLSQRAFTLERERMHLAMHQIIEKQKFENSDQVNEFLSTALANKRMPDIIAMAEPTPAIKALGLVMAAEEAESDAEAVERYKEALAVHPLCLDAAMALATRANEEPSEYLDALLKIRQEADARLGEGYFAEKRGHFWGMVETRPYMRLLEEIVHSAQLVDDYDRAVGVGEEMLSLCPGDNLGIRYALLGYYLRQGSLPGARRILSKFSENTTTFAWGRLFERFLSNDLAASEVAFHEAMRVNAMVLLYVLGIEPLPEHVPDRVTPGSPEDAMQCVLHLGAAFATNESLLLWMATLTRRTLQEFTPEEGGSRRRR